MQLSCITLTESLAARYGPFVYTLNLTETGIR
jgi:hypothetical protein